jgi:hypothetical protein
MFFVDKDNDTLKNERKKNYEIGWIIDRLRRGKDNWDTDPPASPERANRKNAIMYCTYVLLSENEYS